MARPFNNYLRGFLSLLDAKVNGQAPAEFEQAVRATLGAEPFLQSQLAETWRANTAAISAVGFLPVTTPWASEIPVPWIVPADENWLVHYCSISSVVVIASGSQSGSVGLRMNRFSASAVVTSLTGSSGGNANGDFLNVSSNLPAGESFLLYPGDEVGGLVRGAGTTPSNVLTLHMRFTRLKV